MADTLASFDLIMAPLGGRLFLEDYLGRQPLHLEGPADKWQSIMDWAVLDRLLSMTSIWSQHSLALMLDQKRVPVASYTDPAQGRDGGQVLRPDPVRVKTFVAQGATLILNDIDQLTLELSGFCRVMEEALGAKLQANLYLSSQRRQGFQVHFDTHDVFAVHVMGEKTWMVHEGRSASPIAHPLFDNLPNAHHEEAKGRLWKKVRLKPGHLLYLPRGQYHYALADDEPCVHIAFGATYPIGLDVVTHLFERMVQEQVARANLPREEDSLQNRLAELGDRAKALLTDKATFDAVRRFQADFRYPHESYDLLELLQRRDQRYRLKVSGLRLVEQSDRMGLVREGSRQAIEVPAEMGSLIGWVLDRQQFSKQELADAFPAHGVDTVERFLAESTRMGIVGAEP